MKVHHHMWSRCVPICAFKGKRVLVDACRDIHSWHSRVPSFASNKIMGRLKERKIAEKKSKFERKREKWVKRVKKIV